MLKKDELRVINSCLNKADPNEPIFVLRAKDPLAAMAVRHWAAMSQDVHEPEKLQDAVNLACEMDDWRESSVEPNTVGSR